MKRPDFDSIPVELLLNRPYVPNEVRITRGIKKVLVEIDLPPPARGFFQIGRSKPKENRLFRNFAKTFDGFIRHVNPTVISGGGIKITASLTGYGTADVAEIDLCSETSELPFNSYLCTKIETAKITAFSVYIEETESVIECARTAGADASSAELDYVVQDTGGNKYGIRVAHAVVSIKANQDVRYRLRFRLPWLKNFASTFGKLFAHDVFTTTAVDIGGASYNPRGNDPVTAGASKIAIGENTATESPEDYTLTNPEEIDTYFYVTDTETVFDEIIVGYYIPTATKTIAEVGLHKPIYDTDGGQHTTLILRRVLPTPISVETEKLYVFKVRTIFA